jgi:hypothetical protein
MGRHIHSETCLSSQATKRRDLNDAPPLPATLVRRGDQRLLHRPRRQRAGARLRSADKGERQNILDARRKRAYVPTVGL